MTKSERILMEYHTKLIKAHGVSESDRMMIPLCWYINTGRASADYIDRLDKADPRKVMDILEQDGSVEDVLGRLKVLLYRLK